jgi:hypothetical protein
MMFYHLITLRLSHIASYIVIDQFYMNANMHGALYYYMLYMYITINNNCSLIYY